MVTDASDAGVVVQGGGVDATVDGCPASADSPGVWRPPMLKSAGSRSDHGDVRTATAPTSSKTAITYAMRQGAVNAPQHAGFPCHRVGLAIAASRALISPSKATASC
jgi:hypothetical protein